MLLDKGADVNAQGGYYGNALRAASCKGHEKVVQMLLDKGADSNAYGGECGIQAQSTRTECPRSDVSDKSIKRVFSSSGVRYCRPWAGSSMDCRLYAR